MHWNLKRHFNDFDERIDWITKWIQGNQPEIDLLSVLRVCEACSCMFKPWYRNAKEGSHREPWKFSEKEGALCVRCFKEKYVEIQRSAQTTKEG